MSRDGTARVAKYVTERFSEGGYVASFDNLAPLLQHILIQLDHAVPGHTRGRRQKSRHAVVNAPALAFINTREQIPQRHLITRTCFAEHDSDGRLFRFRAVEVKFSYCGAKGSCRIFKIRRAHADTSSSCTGRAGGDL